MDVRPIGPLGTSVGLAGFNGFARDFIGVRMALYELTDLLSLIPLLLAGGFGSLGAIQWIKRKSLWKVDRSILVLGGFYILTAALFLLFEVWVVNYRPVLIEGIAEASYPSSTTLLVLCVMPTAALQFRSRIRHLALRKWTIRLIVAFAAFMVVGRLLSGVHWVTDIIGGLLLSAGLVGLYRAFSGLE